jgi:hypothetical protein
LAPIKGVGIIFNNQDHFEAFGWGRILFCHTQEQLRSAVTTDVVNLPTNQAEFSYFTRRIFEETTCWGALCFNAAEWSVALGPSVLWSTRSQSSEMIKPINASIIGQCTGPLPTWRVVSISSCPEWCFEIRPSSGVVDLVHQFPAIPQLSEAETICYYWNHLADNTFSFGWNSQFGQNKIFLSPYPQQWVEYDLGWEEKDLEPPETESPRISAVPELPVILTIAGGSLGLGFAITKLQSS